MWCFPLGKFINKNENLWMYHDISKKVRRQGEREKREKGRRKEGRGKEGKEGRKAGRLT